MGNDGFTPSESAVLRSVFEFADWARTQVFAKDYPNDGLPTWMAITTLGGMLESGQFNRKERQFVELVADERAKQRDKYDDNHDANHTYAEWGLLFTRYVGRLGEALEMASLLIDPTDVKDHRQYYALNHIAVGDALVTIAALAMAVFQVIDPREVVVRDSPEVCPGE